MTISYAHSNTHTHKMEWRHDPSFSSSWYQMSKWCVHNAYPWLSKLGSNMQRSSSMCIYLTGTEHAGQIYPAGAACGGKLLMCETRQFVWITSKRNQKHIQSKMKVQLTIFDECSSGQMREVLEKSHTQATKPSSLQDISIFKHSLTETAGQRPVILSIYNPFWVGANL